MRAWKDYDVTLTLRISTNVAFSRDTEEELSGIEKSDAIVNAIGSIDPEVFALLESEGFAVTYPIEGEADER